MSFAGFGKLPAELRSAIFEAADEEDEEDIIEVAFTRTPTYEKARRTKPARVVWKYRCFARNPSPLLSVNRDSRANYIRLHPQVLQLNNGPEVHFNAAEDTVYFDASSFAALWFYLTDHVRNFRRGAPDTHRLKGFGLIKTFGSYHPHPTMPGAPGGSTANRVGLRDIRAPPGGVPGGVTGLTSVRLLDDRNIRPKFRPPPPGTLLGEMKKEVRDQLADLRGATTSGKAKYTPAQQNVITDIRSVVNNIFNNGIDLLMATPLDIPEVP